MDYHCLVCGKDIYKKGTPWTLCFDPEFERNVWGGDTHDYIGYFCTECGPKVKEVIQGQYAKGYIAGVKDAKQARLDADQELQLPWEGQ